MADKINICFFIGSFRGGGAENLVLQILQKMDRNIFTPYLCVFSKDGSLKNEFEELDVRIEAFPVTNRFKAPFEYLRFIIFLRSNKISAIHIHLVGTYIFAVTAAVFAGIKNRILHWHNVYELYRTKKYKNVKYGSLLATKIIAISEFVKKRNCEIYKIDEPKVVIIYNAVDVENFTTGQKDKKDIVIGTVGKMTEQKGYDILLNAFAIVLKELPEVKLEIIGNGELEHDITELINNLQLNHNVFLLGVMQNQEVKERMKKWKIFVLASRWEGFGIVLIEAMAMGLPVIASNVEAIPEIVAEGKTGLLFEKNNFTDLAEKTIVLLNNESRMISFGEQGRERVDRYFNLEKTIHELELLYY